MSDAARAWLRAQVMDMGDCEEELVASLTAVLTETRTKALEEAAAVCEKIANGHRLHIKAMGWDAIHPEHARWHSATITAEFAARHIRALKAEGGEI